MVKVEREVAYSTPGTDVPGIKLIIPREFISYVHRYTSGADDGDYILMPLSLFEDFVVAANKEILNETGWFCPGCGRPISKQSVEESWDEKIVRYGCGCSDYSYFEIQAEDFIWHKNHPKGEEE